MTMQLKTIRTYALALLTLMLSIVTLHAQENQVPDLTGLNIPQATAALNAAGLRLGTQTIQIATPQDTQPTGTVLSQSVAAGELVEGGATVDVTVLQAANVRIVYDDNDLTLINETGAALNLRTFTFRSSDGNRQFAPARWRAALPDGDCGQLWSIPRGASKPINGCDSIYWQTTNNSALHFWTPEAGGNFSVLQNDNEVASCAVAPPNSQDNPSVCAFFVNLGRAVPTAEFVYYAYTTDRLAVMNVTPDKWMPLVATVITTPGFELTLGDEALFGNPEGVGNVRRLAPGQCTLLSAAPLTDATPPQDCVVIAQTALGADRVFWTQEFSVRAATGENEVNACPAATPDFVTLCIVPR